MKDLIGQQLDNYRIESLLGEGGMGDVYKARDMNLNRVVAIKVMDERLAKQPQFQQRFQQEAQAAARLKHPSIVQIYHFDNFQGILYMAMTYVPGQTLGKYLHQMVKSQQVVLLKESLSLVAQVADALGYAHRQGVVHRDIKPDNVLLEALDAPDREGEPPVRAVVTDFGLAKAAGRRHSNADRYLFGNHALYVAGTVSRHEHRRPFRPLLSGCAALPVDDGATAL
ncbi:MAG: serine/threonine protein kinase [Chloroflexi bacterium]|nr:serine/threonine protein kinase [Chloroflexota bacterium]